MPEGLPLRVGVIGCGNVAVRHHLPALRRLPDLYEVVAVADPIAARRELASQAAGLGPERVYDDPGAVLERPEVQVVDVCTPQHARPELVMAAARAGKHVMSEKPLAVTARQAAEMVDAARRAGVTLGVVHNYLFFPEIEAALGIIASGEIGAVEVAILNYLGVIDHPGNPEYRPRWRHESLLAGGGVLMDMLHAVYLAEAFLGRPIERVDAYVGTRDRESPVEEIALCRFETSHNAALVNVAWGQGPGGIEVAGTEGRLSIRYRDGGTSPFAPFEELRVSGPQGSRREPVVGAADLFTEVFRDFALALADGREPRASGSQGVHILEATLAAYLSGATGARVSLPLPDDHPLRELGVAALGQLPLPEWSPVHRGLFA